MCNSPWVMDNFFSEVCGEAVLMDDNKRSVARLIGLSTMSQVVYRSLMSPFDRMKFLLQCEPELVRQGRLPIRTLSVRGLFSQFCSREGVASFWRGNTVQCIAVAPLTIYQALLMQRIHGATEGSKHEAIWNSVGLILVSLAAYPIDLARFRLSCDVCSPNWLYRSATDFFRMTWSLSEQRQGRFHRGFVLFILGSYLYRLCFVVTVSTASLLWSKAEPTGQWPALHSSVAALGAMSTATLCLYPLDTVRHRMMLCVNSELQYSSSLECVVQISRREGFGALFKGAKFALLRGALSWCLVALIVQ